MFDKFAKSYIYTPLPDEQDDQYPIIYSTKEEAIKESVKFALTWYIELQSNKDNKFWKGYSEKRRIQQPEEYPKYICLEDRYYQRHSFYILEKENRYKRWQKMKAALTIRLK